MIIDRSFKTVVEQLKKFRISDETVASVLSERVHQESMWNPEGAEARCHYSTAEFALYIEHYLEQATTFAVMNFERLHMEEDRVREVAMMIVIRKVAAMILAAAELNLWMKDLERLFDEMSDRRQDDNSLHYSVAETLGFMKWKARTITQGLDMHLHCQALPCKTYKFENMDSGQAMLWSNNRTRQMVDKTLEREHSQKLIHSLMGELLVIACVCLNGHSAAPRDLDADGSRKLAEVMESLGLGTECAS